jgi:DNA-binding SARP family transcriptional activator
VTSTLELVQLSPDLVETDLQLARRLIEQLKEPQDQQSRVSTALRLVALIRGEFLADLRYEDWVLNSQLVVHAEIRTTLLRIAEGDTLPLGHEATLRAGSALTRLDPYDESAHLAIAKHLASSGRRIQAREFLARFAKRLREDLDEEPSADLQLAAALVGVEVG